MKIKNDSVQIEPVESRRMLAADLVVSKITPTTTFAGQSQVISYQVELRNQSNEIWIGTAIGEGTASLTLDNNYGNGDDVALMGAFTIGTINPGAKKTINVNGTINPNFTAGTYRLAVRLNTQDGNEGNNTSINAQQPIELISRVQVGPVIGTAVRDTIKIEASGNNWRAVVNGVSSIIPSSVDELTINALAGPDTITISTNTSRDIDFEINGYGGNDSIQGGDGDDSINGMDGADTIRAGAGDDDVLGGANADRLYGDDGDDTFSGGGSNDKLYGGKGTDRMMGGEGNDYFDSRESGSFDDIISGNGGEDTADIDDDDEATSADVND